MTVKRNLHNLERYEKVLTLREQGKTYREIAEMIGVSSSRVHQLILNAYYRRDYPEMHQRAKAILLKSGKRWAEYIRNYEAYAEELKRRALEERGGIKGE